MIDMGSIAAALSGIKQIKDVAEAAIDAKQALEVDRVKVELLPAIVQAYTQLLEARSAQADLAERLREAEDAVRRAHEDLARREDWATEAARYRLLAVGDHAHAYALKPEAAGEEPPHYLCQSCYQDQKKLILQFSGYEAGCRRLACPRCQSAILIREPLGEVLTVPRSEGLDFGGY
ncbi:MAG: hypothetical protein Q8O34_00850 [Rhodocyclaceae bacterium]|nr:hypothetical protein [Rhodocyclaceae bacterium]